MELAGRAHLIWKRRVTRNLAPHGLNPKQIFVLRKLDESGGMAPSEIAELVFADRPTVTAMLRTLESNGWVTRRSDPADGRRMPVMLTSRGRAKLKRVPEALWRTGKTEFDPEACFSAREREELVRLLTKLVDYLESDSSDTGKP